MKDAKDPPRGGSVPTRRVLRKEANFGCAICGEPYLTYHHFDPPWAELHHDNPEGMIALCVRHAGMADAKAYTKQQLRGFKQTPSLRGESVKSIFEWLRDDFLFIVGGNIAFKCETIIESSTGPVIWLEKDEETGSRSISMNIHDKDGDLILAMDRNQWTSNLALVEDINSSARGHKLNVVANNGDASFEITFRSISLSEIESFLTKLLAPSNSPYPDVFKKLIRVVKTDITKEFEGEVPICLVTGTFYMPQKVSLRADKMIYGGNAMGCNYSGISKTAFYLG